MSFIYLFIFLALQLFNLFTCVQLLISFLSITIILPIYNNKQIRF